MENQEKAPQKGSGVAKTILWVVGILVALIIIALIVWWIYLVNINKALNEASTASTLSKVPQDTAEVQPGSQFYVSQDYGYSLSYPQSWLLEEDDSDQVLIFTNTTDVDATGILVTILPTGAGTGYEDVEDYMKAQPVGDSVGASAAANTTYSEMQGVKVAKTVQQSPKMTMYTWICNGQVMTMTYQGADYNEYLDDLGSIVSTMIFCES